MGPGQSPGFVPELEQHYIGLVLGGGDQRAALAMVDADNFLEPIHREVFALIQQASAAYGSTTMPVVSKLIPEQLARQFKADTGIELTAYLSGCLANTIYGPQNARHGAKAVVSQWARVNLGREAMLLASAANDVGADPRHLAREMGAQLDAITSHLRRGGRGKSRHRIVNAAEQALADARAARERHGLVGITSGLADLDRATGGFLRRDLVVVAARPAMGKTTLATSISTAAAQSGIGVGMFSLEMDAAKLGARYASDLALARGRAVPYFDIVTGRIDEDAEVAAAKAVEEYRALPFWVEDQSGLTMPEIRAKTEAMIADAEDAGTPIGMLVLDHLLKIRPSARYAGNRTNEVGEVTDGLKELAREYDLAVVLLTQLNRGVEGRDDKRPQLSDLRDSGNIEQDADTVMLLYREAYYLEQKRPDTLDKRIEWEADLNACRNKAELSIAKQRNGSTPIIDLWMDVKCSAVRNAAREHHVNG